MVKRVTVVCQRCHCSLVGRSAEGRMSRGFFCGLVVCAVLLAVAAWPALSLSASPASTDGVPAPTANLGPYNVTFLEGGVGLGRPLSATGPAAAGAPWSITGWLRTAHRQSGEVIVAAIGDVARGDAAAGGDATAGGWRGLVLTDAALS